jgi:hypothetical protein
MYVYNHIVNRIPNVIRLGDHDSLDVLPLSP